MKKNHFFAILLSLAAIVSCDKVGGEYANTRKGAIGVSGVNVGTLGTKSQKGSVSLETASVAGDFSLTVECEESPMEGSMATKATIVSDDNFVQFGVHGFLGSEIKDKPGASEADRTNFHFIDGKSVRKSGSEWNFEETQLWRAGINHSFWGYFPETLNVSVDNDDYSKATFDFVSDFQTDALIAANIDRYYGKDEEPASTKNDKVDFDFYHALSAMQAKVDGMKYYVKKKDGSVVADDPSNKRGEVVSVAVSNVYDKGTCEIESRGNIPSFTWNGMGMNVPGTVTSAVIYDSENGSNPSFIIPQDKSCTEVSGGVESQKKALVNITVKDYVRNLTRPYIFDANEILTASKWEVGTKYNYNVKGSVTFPYVERNIPGSGIDANFKGMPFQSDTLVSNLDLTYVSQLKISWEGKPSGNSGKGTWVFISIEQAIEGLRPVENNYMTTNVDPTKAVGLQNVGFVYTYKETEVPMLRKGTMETVDGKTICSCIIDVPDGWTNCHLWAAYTGANNSGTCNWHLNNCNIEIIKWR